MGFPSELIDRVPLAKILGYLNFSSGRPTLHFRRT